MIPGAAGYPAPVTDHDRTDGPDRAPDAPLDPGAAVDEIEERLAAERSGREVPDAPARDEDDAEVEDPARDGTGVDEESSG